MYLSKLLLDKSQFAKYEVYDDYAIHKLVYSLFPAKAKEIQERILYLDKGASGEARLILIQSQQLPEPPKELQMTSLQLNDSFFAAPRYHFEVLLNPVRRSPASGKREALRGMLPLLSWFVRRCPGWGFSCEEASLQAFVKSSLYFKKNQQSYRFNRVLFRGSLEVTDPARFILAAKSGLGAGKAFGFGLLQLSRAK